MHELSLCAAIADIVDRRADGRAVEVVYVRVGQLRQVVPDALTFCWSMLVEDTGLAGSSLELEAVPARLHCRSCARRFALPDPPAFTCPGCGGVEVAVEAGEELLVTAVRFAQTTAAHAPD